MAKKKKTETTSPKAPKTPKAKKPRQLKLAGEGMQRKSNPDIDAAAEKYREARDTRMDHTKLEKAAKTVLLETAKKYGVRLYLYEAEDGEEFEVEYTEKVDENVKVKKVKAEPSGDDE